MKKFVRIIPTLITCVRLAAAVGLFFLRPDAIDKISWQYLTLYGVCGLSDALDGFLARKLHAESKFGAVIDSLSDIVFYSMMVFTLWPIITRVFQIFPHLAMAALATGIHVIAYIVCAIKFRRFSAVHTYLNKTLGLFFFFFPLSLLGEYGPTWIIYAYYFTGASVAILASTETLLIHCLAKRYDTRNKSIFLIKRNEANSESTPAQEG